MDSSDVFLMTALEEKVFGRKTTDGSALHIILGVNDSHMTSLEMLASPHVVKVPSARFLHWKVTIFSFPCVTFFPM